MAENQEDAELKVLAQEIIRSAEISAFNQLAPDSAKQMNRLIMAGEAGLKSLFAILASGKIQQYNLEALIQHIQRLGADFDDFSEETISILQDTLLRSEYSYVRRIALVLLGEILAWVFPEKKALVDNELISFLFDEDAAIRFTMIRYVKDYQLKAAIPYLINLLYEPEIGQSYYIVQALKAFNTPEALLAIEEWEKRDGRA